MTCEECDRRARWRVIFRRIGAEKMEFYLACWKHLSHVCMHVIKNDNGVVEGITEFNGELNVAAQSSV